MTFLTDLSVVGILTKVILTALLFYYSMLFGHNYDSPDMNGTIDCPVYEKTYVVEYSPKCKQIAKELCPLPQANEYFLRKHHIPKSGRNVFQDAYGELRHPSTPAKTEFFFTQSTYWPEEDPIGVCKHVIMTRTGQRDSQPNKCVAVAILPEKYVSPNLISHRTGFSARLTNQYQNDHARPMHINEEDVLLFPFLRDRSALIQQFIKILGPPLRDDGSRRTAIVMVANEGVMDLLLNFICSARQSKIDLSGLIVFLGQPSYLPLLKAMGVHAMHHTSLGSMPAQAAISYADSTFTRLMWLKVTSVYLASASGFDVLFQDADLVWMIDPIPYLHSLNEDAIFMDDGARTPRFTPFFANTGFYFLRYNYRISHMMERVLRGVGEIGQTHSHQATLNRHLTETQSLLNLKIKILDGVKFPSGIMFHHNKTFMKELNAHLTHPYVFHMCWTTDREEKVKYFKQIGMWFLPDNKPSCVNGKRMLLSLTQAPDDSIEEQTVSVYQWGRRKKRLENVRTRNIGLPLNISIQERCCGIPSHFAI